MNSPLQHFRSFQTTRWSVVFATNGETDDSQDAWQIFCQTYWYPLYAFARRMGKNHHDAQDITQGFLARLMDRDALSALSPDSGKLRTFLLRSLQNFMRNEWRKDNTLKRGGSSTQFSLDDSDSDFSARYEAMLIEAETPEAVFDHCWAVSLLDLAKDRLRQDYLSEEKGDLFDVLEQYLARDHEDLPYADMAEPAGMKADTLRVAVHRFRKRFGIVLREEIEKTVASTVDAEEEIRTLFGALDGV